MTDAGKAHWGRRLIVWLHLRWVTEPPTAAERSAGRRRAHERYLRRLRRRRIRLRRRRIWRRCVRSIDLERPPLPVLRWLAVFGLALAWWAAGAKTSPPHHWIPYVVIVGALILPDVAGFAVGGFKLDLKQARDEIATLRQEVNAQARAEARAGAILALGDKALESLQPGLETMGGILGAGRPGAASTARPLSTAVGGMDASNEEDIPS